MKAKGKDYVLSNVRDFTDARASSLCIKSFTWEEGMIGKEDVEDLAGAVEPMPEPDYTEVLDGEVGPDYYYDEAGDNAENAAADETTEAAKEIEEDAASDGTEEDTAESADVEKETK